MLCRHSTRRCAQTPSHGAHGLARSSYPLIILLSKIASIQDAITNYNANVARISELHSRTLNSTDEAANRQNTAILEDLASQTRELGNSIKQRIQALESQPVQPGQDKTIRKNRVRETTPWPDSCYRSMPVVYALLIYSLIDGFCAIQIRSSLAKLPASRARLPAEVQGASRAAIPYW